MTDVALRELMPDVAIRELMLDVDVGESVLVGQLVPNVAERAADIAVIEYGADAPNSLEETDEVVSQCMVTILKCTYLRSHCIFCTNI